MTIKPISTILSEDLKEENFVTFEKSIEKLNYLRSSLFTQLHVSGNKIISDLYLDKSQLRIAIEQYSTFSNEAIHMLLDARIRSSEWPKMSDEIEENIREELGRFTDGIPHLVMMRKGYFEDLGIFTDQVIPLHFTEYFLGNMRKIFKVSDPAFLAGALIAFEGSAIEEFSIVETIIRRYNNGKIGGLTEKYIKGHQEFEIGHEQHLKDSIVEYIHAKNYSVFCKGYISVCLELHHWWSSLYQHIVYSAYFDYTKK